MTAPSNSPELETLMNKLGFEYREQTNTYKSDSGESAGIVNMFAAWDIFQAIQTMLKEERER